MTNFEKLCKQLELKIQNSYQEGTSLEDAEKLAAEFLGAMMSVSAELKAADLNARMRKVGVKAIRAAIYNEACAKSDKKPTEAQLENTINLNELVQGEQTDFDKAEVDRDALERYYQIFREAHVYYRGVSRGKFD
jgi:hypothetical protein